MSSFSHIPLGQRIPASIHGVSCSLPTMRDVIGYETKDPGVVAKLEGGYPRFAIHAYVRMASSHLAGVLGMRNRRLWLTASDQVARELAAHLNSPEVEILENTPLSGISLPIESELNVPARLYLQHSGTLLSSREAEDYLLRRGMLSTPQEEATFNGYAAAHVKGTLSRAYGCEPADVYLARSGMNAVFTVFRVIDELQRTRGRTCWIQLGWLYLDTIAILQKFTANPAEDYRFVHDVFDLEALKQLFAEKGDTIAGVITEVPTNPLIQTTDLPALAELCRAHGAALIVDPTIASPWNIDVLPHIDVVVNSLTKYTAPNGDILMGTVVVNNTSPFAAVLRERLPSALAPVYSRDLDRLASEIGGTRELIDHINESTPAVIEFLRKHPKIDEVFWSGQDRSAANYAKLARSPECVGSMITFTLKMPLDVFYDRLRMPKGPSFGMATSLVCPFMYLAHFDLVTSEEGRAFLKRSGLNPDLIRLSVGAEPADEIIEVLREALDGKA